MAVSFRLGRYLVALLWSWSVPLIVGVALGGGYVIYTTLEVLDASDNAFVSSIEAAIAACESPTDPPP